MVNYVYRARSAKNELVTGRIQATNIEAAQKTLQENGLTPLGITQPRSFTDYLPFINKVSLKDRTLFARQLATMLEAGLTLAQALRLLVRQTKPGQFHTVLNSILTDVQDGFSFSNALAKHTNVFDNIFINVVRSGEATGKLEVVLKELAQNLEKEVGIKTKIRGALVYPAFIFIVMIGVALIMTTQVIPQLKDVFTGSGQELPASTNLLLFLSDVMVNYWYIVLIGVIVLLIAFRIFWRSEQGIEFYSKFSLKAPVMGGIVEQAAMARFARLLGLLLNSGVPLLEALRLINDSFTNRVHQRAMLKVAADVERGIPMSTPIMKDPAFPAMVGQMVSVGEQTGRMDEVMTKLAEYFESELDTKVSALASLVEPIVIIVLGLGVAWLIQAILLPIYSFSSSV